MDLILIGALTVSLLVVASYGVHSLLQMRGATVFPLLRFGENKEVRKTILGSLQTLPVGFGGSAEKPSRFLEGGGGAMVLVKQVMKENPLKIRGDESVQTAAEIMTQKRVGSLLVENGLGEIHGIVTETDIVRKVTATHLQASELLVETIMSAPVITIAQNRPVTEADELMDRHHIRHVAVTENGRIIGMLSVRDLLHPIYGSKG